MTLWGVVLMTVTYANGGVVHYGDVERDTYVGWFEKPEMCAGAAAERNARYSIQDWWNGESRYYFECHPRKQTISF